MSTQIAKTIQDLAPEIAVLRHELHQHPEIRFQEQWTSDRIAQWLDGIGLPYKRGYAKGTGIVATVEGEGDGIVGLRADIDALEIEEETGLPYTSTIPQRMHACGHDGHTAILCGVAKALAQNKDAIQGTVKLIFQPAEEIAAGGRFIVEEGVLDDVGAVFALHGWPQLPAGKIGVKNGWLLASTCDFHITVKGIGGHAADPGSCIDPVLVASHITTALQSIVSRETNPWDAAVVSVTKIHGGDATNIIPETAVMEGTFRSLSNDIHEKLCASIERIAVDTARAFRATADVHISSEPYPALFNDEAMTDFARETIVEQLGEDAKVELPNAFMAGEDFAFYLQKVPGTFVLVGVHDGREGPYPPLHSPHFNFNDESIAPAMNLMAHLAVKYLAGN